MNDGLEFAENAEFSPQRLLQIQDLQTLTFCFVDLEIKIKFESLEY